MQNGNTNKELSIVTETKTSKPLLLVVILGITALAAGFVAGYFVSPEKIVEVEKIIETEVEVEKIVKVDRVVDTGGNSVRPSKLYREGGYDLTSEYDIACGWDCSFVLKTKQGELITFLNEDFTNWWDEEKQEEYGNLTLLNVAYFSENGFIYFSMGIPDTSACCMLVAYDINKSQFKVIDIYRGVPSALVTSTGFLVIADLDGKAITAYDLDKFNFDEGTFHEVLRIEIDNGTLDTGCGGFFENGYSLYSTRTGTVFYGINEEGGGCDEEGPFEHKVLPLPFRYPSHQSLI